MTSNPNPHKAPRARRKKILFLKGFQLRYTMMVVGSLFVMLMFAGFHGVYVAQSALPEDAYLKFSDALQESTIRLFVVGLLYIAVLALAAIFLSHRTLGPTARIEEEIHGMLESDKIEPLKIRTGDDFEGLISSINKIIRKLKKK